MSGSPMPFHQSRARVYAIAIGIALVVIALTIAFVVFDRMVLDPGGRGFAGDANDACADHDGVKEMNAFQGTIICRDGWAAE